MPAEIAQQLLPGRLIVWPEQRDRFALSSHTTGAAHPVGEQVRGFR